MAEATDRSQQVSLLIAGVSIEATGWPPAQMSRGADLMHLHERICWDFGISYKWSRSFIHL